MEVALWDAGDWDAGDCIHGPIPAGPWVRVRVKVRVRVRRLLNVSPQDSNPMGAGLEIGLNRIAAFGGEIRQLDQQKMFSAKILMESQCQS